MPKHTKKIITPTKMAELDNYNIPAFKRKRSIAAKARTNHTTTPEIMEPPPVKSSKKQQPLEIDETYTREMKICGTCDGYFDNIKVAIIKLTNPLRKDDIILMEKHDGLFEQKVNSMQIDRKDVSIARTGSDVGVKVLSKPQVGGTVYKVIA